MVKIDGPNLGNDRVCGGKVRIPLPNPVNVRETLGKVKIDRPNPVNHRLCWGKVKIDWPNLGNDRLSWTKVKIDQSNLGNDRVSIWKVKISRPNLRDGRESIPKYQNLKNFLKLVQFFSKILYVLNYFNTWKIFKSIFSNFQSPKFQNNTRPNLHIGFPKIVKNFFLGKSLASLGIFIAMYWITRGGGAIFLRASRSKNCARTLPSHISWR